MRTGLSLRWRLILVSGALAAGVALVLTVVLQLRTRNQLMQQLGKTLEWKCDEVITVLEGTGSLLMLEQFFLIETNYRSSPHTYFYQMSDAQGRIIARSENLGDFELRIPELSDDSPVHFRTEPQPFSPGGERILLRSERVEIAGAGGEPATFVIQTAASLVPFESAVGRQLGEGVLVAAASVAAVFFLLWFVTTRSLWPVSEMTKKARQITAMDLRERLPLTGRGDELDELAGVLNDMLDRLAASMRQIERFSSDAAHELRTPLTRIRGELELLLRGEGCDSFRTQLETIQEELERLGRLCSRLLLLARLDQKAADAALLDNWVDLQQVVSELLEQMTPLAHERGVRLGCGESSAARVRGSRALLVEALLNLLDNAIRSTPEGGSVSVSIDSNGDLVRVSVQDTGPGVPPDEREQIFQRFYRLPRDGAGTTDDGVGLGLAIVKGIAQAHGGGVELVDAPGGGSVFRLVLPAQYA